MRNASVLALDYTICIRAADYHRSSFITTAATAVVNLITCNSIEVLSYLSHHYYYCYCITWNSARVTPPCPDPAMSAKSCQNGANVSVLLLLPW